MEADRRERISALYHQALARAPEERRAFLIEACSGDETLRQEVESLLAYEPVPVPFLDGPAAVAVNGSRSFVGTRLGPYQIVALLGAGGMGEVYRAHDTTLGRDVAVKILPRHLTADPERRARFAREARLLATLNHPHIGTIYGVQEADGQWALILELIDGPTLARRLERGPLTVADALAVARQIADALEAAHDKGIVHRDLKPANIVLQETSGAPRVKVLDFGLAKAVEPADSTRTGDLFDATTGKGRILGTPAYMSPEQARGLPVDKRTDVWAFGCVLYEMLAGRSAFAGKTVPDTLASVLDREPDWSALPAQTPTGVRAVLRRCLRKDPEKRQRDIGDARIEIEEADAPPPSLFLGKQPAGSLTPTRGRRWLALGAAAVGLVGVAIAVTVWRTARANPQVVRALWDVAPAVELDTGSVYGVLPGGSRTGLAWSPDGRTLAFIGIAGGVRRIYLRDLGSETGRALEGTDNAETLAFSPDGESIAFSAGGTIRRVRVDGGPTSKVCDAARVTGISWGTTRVVYTNVNRLLSVSPDGGEPETIHESALRLSSPVLLPGDVAVLFTAYGRFWTSGDERVLVQRLPGGSSAEVLLEEAADAKYLPTGHLAFLRQGTVFVAPFNIDTLQMRGGAVAVLKEVAQSVATWAGMDLTFAGQYAISSQGTLAYVAGGPRLPASELVEVSREGVVTSLGAAPAVYRGRADVSPDGGSVAVGVQTPRHFGLFVFDRRRRTVEPLLTEPAGREVFAPRWSRDGRSRRA